MAPDILYDETAAEGLFLSQCVNMRIIYDPLRKVKRSTKKYGQSDSLNTQFDGVDETDALWTHGSAGGTRPGTAGQTTGGHVLDDDSLAAQKIADAMDQEEILSGISSPQPARTSHRLESLTRRDAVRAALAVDTENVRLAAELRSKDAERVRTSRLAAEEARKETARAKTAANAARHLVAKQKALERKAAAAAEAALMNTSFASSITNSELDSGEDEDPVSPIASNLVSSSRRTGAAVRSSPAVTSTGGRRGSVEQQPLVLASVEPRISHAQRESRPRSISDDVRSVRARRGVESAHGSVHVQPSVNRDDHDSRPGDNGHFLGGGAWDETNSSDYRQAHRHNVHAVLQPRQHDYQPGQPDGRRDLRDESEQRSGGSSFSERRPSHRHERVEEQQHQHHRDDGRGRHRADRERDFDTRGGYSRDESEERIRGIRERDSGYRRTFEYRNNRSAYYDRRSRSRSREFRYHGSHNRSDSPPMLTASMALNVQLEAMMEAQIARNQLLSVKLKLQEAEQAAWKTRR